jgi:uncharacterized lipoprotein YajG
MKKIVLALTFVLVGSFMLAGCSKDEILNHYNNIVQSAGAIELTGKLSLKGTKEKGSEGCSSRTSVLKEIIFLIQRNQEKPILQGLQRLWEVVRCAGISMECNTYATSMQQIYQWYV